MNDVFKDYLRKFILVFFDDILIYSKTWEDHMHHLAITFSTMQAHQLHVNIEKCKFGQSEVMYLGYVISNTSVVVDPQKMEVMLNWPKPMTSVWAFETHWLLYKVHLGLWQDNNSINKNVEKECFEMEHFFGSCDTY